MANVSVSELVLFIAAITVAAGVATTLTANVMDMSNAISERGDGVATKISTEIELINDPGSPDSIYNNSTVTLLVKNAGGQTVDAVPGKFDVLVDGSYATVESVSVVGESSVRWSPGDVAKVNVSRTLAPGEHRVVVYVNGDEELLRFRSD